MINFIWETIKFGWVWFWIFIKLAIGFALLTLGSMNANSHPTTTPPLEHCVTAATQNFPSK